MVACDRKMSQSSSPKNILVENSDVDHDLQPDVLDNSTKPWGVEVIVCVSRCCCCCCLHLCFTVSNFSHMIWNKLPLTDVTKRYFSVWLIC